MLEYYIQIIESFKKHQISILLRTIREKIIDFIESEHFTSQAQDFFRDIAGCRLMLMPSNPIKESINPQISVAYILTNDNKLYYFNRAQQEPLIEIPISSENYHALKNALAIKSLNEEHTSKIVTNALSQEQLDVISKYSRHEHIANCRLFFIPAVPKVTDFDQYTHKAYILTADNKLYYFNRLLSPSIKEVPIALQDYEALKANFELDSGEATSQVNEIIHSLSLAQLSIITKHSGHQHKENDPPIPFTDFTSQPRQVVQLKEVINALYHAELAFRDLESVNLRDGKNRLLDTGTLYYHTIEHGYMACYILTHLDLQTQQVFSQEIALILKLLAQVQKYAADYGDKASIKIAEFVENYPISYTAGNIAGIAIDQMQPSTGNVDYNFLAQFSAVLPRYIQQLTEYIHKYTNQITDLEPTLDKQKINELEDNAIKLLQAINDAQSNTFLFTFKGISYLHIIQHVTTLALSTIEQMGHMSEATQDVIRDNLSTLKYNLFVELFALVDKVEDEALLTPGTLSMPLMQVVIPFYQKIIQYASKPVDFAVKGKELLTLEDQKFIDLRIDKIQQRINSAEKQLFKSQEIQNAFNAFFSILENHKGYKRITDLPDEIKKELNSHYIYIQSYFEKVDVDLHNEILRGLQTSAGGRFNQVRNLYFQLRGHTTDHLEKIINLKPNLYDSIKSDIATYKFHIEFNRQLINSVRNHADLALYPIELSDKDINCAKPVVFSSDPDSQLSASPTEAIAAAQPTSQTILNTKTISKSQSVLELLNFNEIAAIKLKSTVGIEYGLKAEGRAIIITEPEALTAEQTLDLLEYYQTEKARIIAAKEKFNLFLNTLSDGNSLIEKENKKELSRWYSEFQPYFLRIFLTDKKLNIRHLDKLITANLTSSSTSQPAEARIGINKWNFRYPTPLFNSTLDDAMTFCTKRIEVYQELSNKKLKEETKKKVLQPNYTYGNRAHYLLKHTNYSKAVSEFRQAIFNLTELFTDPLRVELKAAASGVPFPEVEMQDGLWAQSKQVLSIKQIYNSLYHLEQICLQLEELNDKSYQSIYVKHVVEAYNHIDEIYKAAKSLYEDPYLRLLAEDIIEKASKIQQVFLTQSEAYTVDPESVTNVKGQVKQNSIWYTLQAFLLIPSHIKALSKQQTISPEELKETQEHTKEITLKIERIIAKSNSYFKLLLETPTMYGLFKELKQKLTDFTTTTHQSVVDNIREINTVHFTDILVETDKWEDRLGLKPGLLSGPMQEILSEFYRGLVEPLGFTSDNYFDLITDLTPFIKRKEACKKVAAAAQSKINENDFNKNYKVLSALVQSISTYHNFTTGPIPPAEPFTINFIKDKIIEDSLAIKSFLKEQNNSNTLKDNQLLLDKLKDCIDISRLAKLIKLINTYNTLNKAPLYGLSERSNLLNIPPNQNNEDELQQVIQLKQQIINTYKKITKNLTAQKQLTYDLSPSLTDTEILQLNTKSLWQILAKQLPIMKSVFSYYKGIYATYKVTEETAKKKEAYIEKLAADQDILNEKIKQDYIQREINKRVQIIINQQTDLINLNGEYNSALEKDLLSEDFQSALAKQVYNETDIKLAIKVRLLARAQAFKIANLDKYARLDYVLTTITDFQLYLRKSDDAYNRRISIFEDDTSLTIKKAQINNLLKLAQKNQLNDTVDKCFEKIRDYISFEYKENDENLLIAKQIKINNLLTLAQKSLEYDNTEDYLAKIRLHMNIVFKDKQSLTLQKKQIEYLLEVTQRKLQNVSVEKRFAKICNHVDTGAFRADMLTYRRFEHISFNWLVNCFLSLLKALHLYKPTSLKRFEQINDAVSDKPRHMPRYGFFTESAREQQRYDLPFKFNFGREEPPSDIELTEGILVPPLAT
ncbi:SdhA, GRIP coiled-coil protein GCC185 [Legionella busanensis]|uniref:SdhA, GRIP coiled-coil protein GCC185 n=1 Tax=Legionella busanensis TaxID=190655 RepID=A0A378JPS5_9GAMM|nr:hypothetical protein [Legionella busanensis]STX52711.1 SdhA, GRIP coiled-coil protein GCC185 [Legionella busanensis]